MCNHCTNTARGREFINSTGRLKGWLRTWGHTLSVKEYAALKSLIAVVSNAEYEVEKEYANAKILES